MIDCAVIIVAYRSAEDVPPLLDSLRDGAGSLSWHAVVVDNYGNDALSERIGADARVDVIDAGANLGFSGGLNLGVTRAPRARFLLFLNPDLRLAAGAIPQLIRIADERGAAAAVPLIMDEQHRPQRSLRREPSMLRALGEALFGDHWPGRPGWLSEMVRDAESYRRAGAVDWATGAALLVRSEVVEQVGSWDAGRFFLYSEETDFSRRIREAGHEIVFTPDAVAYHRGAGSGSSTALDALLCVNKVRYYRKWHPVVPTAVFFAISVLHNLLRVNRPEARASLKALLSSRNRAGLPGMTA